MSSAEGSEPPRQHGCINPNPFDCSTTGNGEGKNQLLAVKGREQSQEQFSFSRRELRTFLRVWFCSSYPFPFCIPHFFLLENHMERKGAGFFGVHICAGTPRAGVSRCRCDGDVGVMEEPVLLQAACSGTVPSGRHPQCHRRGRLTVLPAQPELG